MGVLEALGVLVTTVGTAELPLVGEVTELAALVDLMVSVETVAALRRGLAEVAEEATVVVPTARMVHCSTAVTVATTPVVPGTVPVIPGVVSAHLRTVVEEAVDLVTHRILPLGASEPRVPNLMLHTVLVGVVVDQDLQMVLAMPTPLGSAVITEAGEVVVHSLTPSVATARMGLSL